jgi:Lipoprotein LpqB beta-propeller domain/Sporulation and spore germination
MTRRRPTRAMLLVTAATAVAVLSGCASIPTSGPVEQRGEVRTAGDDTSVRVLAKGPTDGMTQADIVEGFLLASASFDDDHGVARSFLAPETQQSWDPNQGTVIYADDADRKVVDKQGNGLELRAHEVATITPRGEYAAADTLSVVKAAFSLRRVDGQWRIADLPDGLLLTPRDVDRSYRAFDLYFLDPTSTRLVPNTIFLPFGPSASTSLVTELLAGPTDWLAPAVRSAFPSGTALSVPSAPVQDGVVQVDLSDTVLDASLNDLQLLSAQLVWTLRQLPGVSAVRITAGGVPLPGVDAEQPADGWAQFSPDGPAVGDALVVRDGRLVRLAAGEIVAVPGKLGDGSIPAADPAISPEGDQIAALSPELDTLYLTAPNADSVQTALTGTQLTPPSWDPFGAVWTVSRTSKGSAVWTVRPGDETPRRVSAPDLDGQRVVALRVARDGVRVAVIVDGPKSRHLLLGRIERSADTLTLGGLRRVESSLDDVADVAWADADQMAVIGQEPNGSLQPLLVDSDGTVSPASGSLSDTVRIAAAPGQPLVAATADGKLWLSTAVGWQPVDAGSPPKLLSGPSYPG